MKMRELIKHHIGHPSLELHIYISRVGASFWLPQNSTVECGGGIVTIKSGGNVVAMLEDTDTCEYDATTHTIRIK